MLEQRHDVDAAGLEHRAVGQIDLVHEDGFEPLFDGGVGAVDQQTLGGVDGRRYADVEPAARDAQAQRILQFHFGVAIQIDLAAIGEGQLDAAKKFLAWVVGPQGCETARTAVAPPGPFSVKGCDLPADVPAAVTDVARYVVRGAYSPALEFLSPVKGPSLEQITVEVGSGIRSAQDGAALYDEDVRKQAQQLGLPGWQ